MFFRRGIWGFSEFDPLLLCLMVIAFADMMRLDIDEAVLLLLGEMLVS